jgi:uncharacterized membrane-anchored protein YjiN (DUF445 family)
MDKKPKGDEKRLLHKQARAGYKEELREDMAEEDRADAVEQELAERQEIDEAWYCHMYGPCEMCKQIEEDEDDKGNK